MFGLEASAARAGGIVGGNRILGRGTATNPPPPPPVGRPRHLESSGWGEVRHMRKVDLPNTANPVRFQGRRLWEWPRICPLGPRAASPSVPDWPLPEGNVSLRLGWPLGVFSPSSVRNWRNCGKISRASTGFHRGAGLPRPTGGSDPWTPPASLSRGRRFLWHLTIGGPLHRIGATLCAISAASLKQSLGGTKIMPQPARRLGEAV